MKCYILSLWLVRYVRILAIYNSVFVFFFFFIIFVLALLSYIRIYARISGTICGTACIYIRAGTRHS